MDKSMSSNIIELKTSDTLLQALKVASAVKLSAKEILEQRISFVFGSIDADSDVTREHIKQVISEQEGISTE